MAEKQQLKITPWNAMQGKAQGQPFEAMINPTGYQLKRSTTLARDGGSDGKEVETLTLDELVLDGTGVVPAGPGTPLTVEQQVERLSLALRRVTVVGDVLYPVVQVLWGSLHYIGRVQSFTVKYTLFAPDGTPLRARLSIELLEYKKGNDASRPPSPAGTIARQLQVTAGLRLPELCFEAYSDPGMAAAVARYNNLTSIRNVPAGMAIACPPKS